MNLDKYESIGTHWVALYVNAENIAYFHSFGGSIFQNKLEKSM